MNSYTLITGRDHVDLHHHRNIQKLDFDQKLGIKSYSEPSQILYDYTSHIITGKHFISILDTNIDLLKQKLLDTINDTNLLLTAFK